MDDFKPNSHRFKNEEKNEVTIERKKVDKIVNGKVTTKKKTGLQKFRSELLSSDIDNVKDYIFLDVLIPTIKEAISDIVKNGIDMVLYSNGRSSNKNKRPSEFVSYDKRYSSNKSNDRYARERVSTGYNVDDIILETRGEAEDVLYRMDELIDRYGIVSVADLYDLVGVTGNYTDNKYGWTSIRNAEPVRVRGGYTLRLPKAMPL